MQTIENTKLKVDVDELGAQLTHIIAKNGNFDYLWNGVEWKRHAPILFPAIGRSNDDKYIVNGKTYNMHQHGFARDYPWTVVDKGDDRITLTLVANDETLKLYPFNFEISVTYTLQESKLLIKFDVKNNSEQNMPFALGFHPGFNVPIDGDQLNFNDYELNFEPKIANLEQFEINPVPFRDGKKLPIKDAKGSALPLNHRNFDDGLIVIANQGIRSVKLNSKKSQHSIYMRLESFPYLTLWTMENTDAKFLCIEPFAGLPDIKADKPTDWASKEGNNHLTAGERKDFSVNIDFE